MTCVCRACVEPFSLEASSGDSPTRCQNQTRPAHSGVPRVPRLLARRLTDPASGYDEWRMALTDDDSAGAPFQALVDRGEQRGCIELSEIDELVQASGIEEDDLGKLYETLD